ncbi:MAG: hypothetical protein JWM58_1088 [Rhizobium sp.]|nr:hypothetical protein [Rhizobium sp.]
MAKSTARHRQVDLPSAAEDIFRRTGSGEASVIVETAVVVNNLDRLISGRVFDLELLKSIAENLQDGASKADIHRKLLILARSSREAFRSLQTSRGAMIALHKKSAGGEVVGVVDQATGLPNKAAFEARLEEAVQKSASTFDTVLMLVELGALPLLATEKGGKTANRVVKRFSTILRRTIKHSDFIARISTQHFAIIFENMLPDNAAPIALRIHNAMEARLSPGDDPVMKMLSVTIGITGNNAGDKSGADLYQRAQDALILARKQVGAGIYLA